MAIHAYYDAAEASLQAARTSVAARGARTGSWQISDVIDADHQYVDLVMEGGGVLGIALIGYVYVLEELGVRFLQVGGTSAGSINALLMAAAGPVQEKKTEWLLTQLTTQNLYEFVDGDDDARDFVKVLLENGRLLKYLWKGSQIIDNLTQDFGLNPGHAFHAWLRRLLAERGIASVRDLTTLRTLTAADGLHLRTGEVYAPAAPIRVALVTADVTTESKVIFPEMAPLYYQEPNEVNPADFVRASMSVPLFFHPYQVSSLPRSGQPGGVAWEQATGYQGLIPETVFFVDGGIMSNFPIDVFHCHYAVPKCPTFGVKLGQSRNRPNSVGKLTSLLGAVFNSARHVHDYDFITHHPDYRLLVSYVETSRFNWLDFSLSEQTKVELFAEGARAAANFVAQFDWEGYKQVRRQLLKAYQVTNAIKPSTSIS
ncbi:patatin-like phospholipase family protein [Hymenobacter sp. BT664]|uniref:Patatin-like phospholipase family protein n=1 Tax=Hymenobacter montanus TaxID=2771359 RepID=A0A927BFW6_9BACT|nr:patatin-like phospholipase family protein [Hymenobacter montanus]MBD2770151.1 patatin-like phospholipase family protein [Hymenobacter montanus]